MRRGLALLLLVPGPALADGHAVTVVNRTGDTIRQVYIAPAGASSPGENRLRSQLPPNAEARITYSTGCKVDVRLGFDGGRIEAFTDQDACAELRVTAGQGAASGPVAAAAPAVPSRPNPAVQPAAGKAAVPLAPPVVVPPWTGHSITKRFGGLD